MSLDIYLILAIFILLLLIVLIIYAYIHIFIFPKYRENLKSSWRSAIEFWDLKDMKRFLKENLRRKN